MALTFGLLWQPPGDITVFVELKEGDEKKKERKASTAVFHVIELI